MKSILLCVFISALVSLEAFAYYQSVVPKSSDLFAALKSKNHKLVKKMVKAGAPLNELRADGKTVLDVVVEQGYFKLARFIFSYGGCVTSERNARDLKYHFRALGWMLFSLGCALLPFLFIPIPLLIGSIVPFSRASRVHVLGC